MNNKRFKIGDEVKVVSVRQPERRILLNALGVIDSYDSVYDYHVKFDKFYQGYNGTSCYDCDLEPAESAKPATVKLEIEIPVIPEDKIPAGMKLGNPEYEIKSIQDGDLVYSLFNKDWSTAFGFNGQYGIVANFVPVEPEEPEFIDKERFEDGDDYWVDDVDGCRKNLSIVSAYISFVEYLWKDADGRIIHTDMWAFRHMDYGVCTHVRFINPKFKKGE